MAKPPRMTLDDFLAWENDQPDRNEFIAGRVYAMVGASLQHNTISLNIAATLRERLRGSPCRAFMEGARVVTDDASFYPDVFVACGQRLDTTESSAPEVIVEVLSPSTMTYDRGTKWFAYQGIASLRHYVMVWQTEARAEVYTRDGSQWRYETVAGLDATVLLPAIGAALPLAAVYEDAPPAPEDPEAEAEAHPS